MNQLNFAKQLLNLGQRYLSHGRTADAVTILSHLTSIRELAGEVAAQAHMHLGEIELNRRDYKAARRHFRLVLNHAHSAKAHYLMALSLRSRNEKQQIKACKHFARSLKLESDQLDCLAEYGQLLIRMGRYDEGLTKLREAWQRSEGDHLYLTKLIKGLRLAGRTEEARQEIRSALFLYRRDRRFLKIWNDFRFQEVRKATIKRRTTHQDGEAVLLPFERVTIKKTDENGEETNTEVRLDATTRFGAPHRSMHPSDHRNAQ